MNESGKRFSVLTILTVFVGLATLLSILFAPALGQQILAGGTILAVFALLLGVLNLLRVHAMKVTRERNLYSFVLVIGMLAVFGLAITDALAITADGVNSIFKYVQAPLESAMASLLAFVLLFAGFRLLQNRRNIWSVLFMLAAVFILISSVPFLGNSIAGVRTLLEDTVVVAGMRGILIGVALGTLTIATRLLIGLDQPYNK